MSTSTPTTRIGSPTSDTSRFRMRGRDVLSEIVGEKRFSEVFYLIVTGREPTPAQAKLLDASIVIMMDHGITSTAMVARMVESAVPGDVQLPVAAGLLMVGDKIAGAMAGCGQILQDCASQDGDRRQWLAEKVAKLRAQKRAIPGFGHRYYKTHDPRAARLFEVARANGVEGQYIELVHVLGEEVDKVAGRHITLNVTAALGAVLSEIGFPVEVMRSVAVVGRAAGLVAHVYEEKVQPIAPALTRFVNEIEYVED